MDRGFLLLRIVSSIRSRIDVYPTRDRISLDASRMIHVHVFNSTFNVPILDALFVLFFRRFFFFDSIPKKELNNNGNGYSSLTDDTGDFFNERKGTKIKIICSNSELLQRIDDKYRGGGEGEREGEGNCAERKT